MSSRSASRRVVQLRREDVQKRHCAILRAHLEITARRELEAAWRDEILDAQATGREQIPRKLELLLPVDVEDAVHQREPRAPVQRLGLDTELAEVVENIRLKPFESRLRSLVSICLDAERDVLALNEAVVTALELVLQHGAVLCAQAVILVAAQGYGYAVAVGFLVGSRVDERELKTDRGVKVIEEVAPGVKYGVLVLVLTQLVVNVLKLYGLAVKMALHAAYPVREHSLKRDAVLRGEHGGGTPGGGNSCAHLAPFTAVKFCERFYAPPGLTCPAFQGPHRGCSSCMAAASAVRSTSE